MVTGWWYLYLRLWKIWVRQLGLWNCQDMESHKIHVPNHQPGNFPLLCRIIRDSNLNLKDSCSRTVTLVDPQRNLESCRNIDSNPHYTWIQPQSWMETCLFVKHTYNHTHIIYNIYGLIVILHYLENSWNKAMWGWFPLLTIISVTSQWG